MHDEVNFTELNGVTDHCVCSIMDADTFQQVKMGCAKDFFKFFIAKPTDQAVVCDKIWPASLFIYHFYDYLEPACRNV